MGNEMLQNTVFRGAITEMDPIVTTEAGFSALKVLKIGEFGASDRVQPLIVIIQISLAAVLQSIGIAPNAIVSHSVGIAGSVVAGALAATE